jgi:Transcriptional regulator, AbiEi antitoxin
MANQVPRELLELAEFQQGVISKAQALAAGLSKGTLRCRIDSGRWQRVYPGVVATFTGELPRQATLWAAVLRAGPGAILSFQSAAEADGLLTRRPGLIHVTVPGSRHVGPIPGLVIHRCERAGEMRHPTRTPPRTRLAETVLDLAGSARTFDEAFNWLCLASAGRFVTPARLREAMGRRSRLRWRAEISVGLDEVADGVHSWLERRYLHAVERPHGLPLGEAAGEAPARPAHRVHRHLVCGVRGGRGG